MFYCKNIYNTAKQRETDKQSGYSPFHAQQIKENTWKSESKLPTRKTSSTVVGCN